MRHPKQPLPRKCRPLLPGGQTAKPRAVLSLCSLPARTSQRVAATDSSIFVHLFYRATKLYCAMLQLSYRVDPAHAGPIIAGQPAFRQRGGVRIQSGQFAPSDRLGSEAVSPIPLNSRKLLHCADIGFRPAAAPPLVRARLNGDILVHVFHESSRSGDLIVGPTQNPHLGNSFEENSLTGWIEFLLS